LIPVLLTAPADEDQQERLLFYRVFKNFTWNEKIARALGCVDDLQTSQDAEITSQAEKNPR
jgi:hypothetical protein